MQSKEESRAAKEFKQRSKTYNKDEDGLLFQSWYHVDDVRRVIWAKFNSLNTETKKDTLPPYVFFDGLDQYNLEEMLSPLVNELKNGEKKYYPFIFKPELASVHYVAGFLRKNDNGEVSILLFNPTGTDLRVDYGNYGYQLRLMPIDTDDSGSNSFSSNNSGSNSFSSNNSGSDDFEIEKNSIYISINNGLLEYTLLDLDGFQITNSFTKEDLGQMGIVDVDLTKPLTIEELNYKLKPKLAKISEKTRTRNETEEKIQIISSPHRIQTIEKDGGRLVSCGPLSIAFIEYIISHPENMASLNEDFHLPDLLANLLTNDKIIYQKTVLDLRQKHYEVLNTIEDSSLENVDESYVRVTHAILKAKDLDDTSKVDPVVSQTSEKFPDLSMQCKAFSELLAQFEKITKRLEEKKSNSTNSEYDVVVNKARTFHSTLKNESDQFFKNPSLEAFNAFQVSCNKAISQAAEEFKKHRGIWYRQIHPVIRGLLGILAGLTLILPFIVPKISKHSYVDTFFAKPKTNAEQELDEWSKKEKDIESEIKQTIKISG